MRKKVLFVVTKSNLGGAQRYVYDLATHLPADEYEPIVACGAAQDSDSSGELIHLLAQANIRTVFIPGLNRDVSPIRDWWAFRTLLGLFRTEKPDIVHLNSSKIIGLGALAARLTSVPHIIATIHGWAFREPRNILSKFIIYKLSALSVLLSHETICLSEYDARAFRKFPLLGRKIHIVRNAAKSTAFPLERGIARQRVAPQTAGQHATDIWVGSIGELTRNKNMSGGLAAVADAIARGAPLYYVVIGDGEERTDLIRTAAGLGLTGHVHFAGTIPNAADVLPAFDILLIPSKKEGVPYVLLEAAQLPLTVVASSVGGIPEYIEDGVSGKLCQAGDTTCFSRALEALAADKTLRDTLAQALAKKAGSDDFARMLRETCDVYRS